MSQAVAAALDSGGGGELWGAILRLLAGLALILPLVYGLTLLYARRLMPGSQARAIRVIETVSLGPNRTISLIEVADRVLVVGATAQHISTLAELTDPQVVESLKSLRPRGDHAAFSKILAQHRRGKKSRGEGEDGV